MKEKERNIVLENKERELKETWIDSDLETLKKIENIIISNIPEGEEMNTAWDAAIEIMKLIKAKYISKLSKIFNVLIEEDKENKER